jgi:probable rRNA maturation factor
MIDVANTHPFLRFPKAEIRNAVRRVLEGEKTKFALVSVVLTGHALIRKVNLEFLRHDRTTDVIAFNFGDRVGVQSEIYVNLDQARRQAREYGVTFSEETRRLLIHGTLHLVGFRDKTPSGRNRMKRKEDRYLFEMDRRRGERSNA